PQEAFLYGQAELTPGARTAFRVFVRNGASAEPIAGADVRARLVGRDGRTLWQGEAETDPHGFAEVEPEVPADSPEGRYTLHVGARSEHGGSSVSRRVRVQRSFRVMVSTDKPLYQPGQTLHIRTLSLSTADGRPVAGRDAVIEVRDARGNKVFKKPSKTSEFGIAAADFQLADQVNTGAYTIAAVVGDTTSERTVRVERYTLPKFKIELATDRGYYQTGQTLEGDLTATYTFGEPVAGGKVVVTASEFIETFREFARAEGTTDKQGRFHFALPLKDHFVGQARTKGDAFVSLEATVVDPAGHEQTKTLDRIVTAEPIRVELFPESGELVQGVENILYIVTAYPDGRPAKTTLTMGKTDKAVETSDLGIAKVTITPHKPQLQLTVTAEDERGLEVTAVRKLRIGRAEGLLLRPDKAVYQSGETANLTVLSTARTERAFLDVVKDRRAVLTKALDIQDGRAELALDLPPDLFGTVQLHAYRILRDGNILGDARVVQVNRADDLAIAATLDKETYRPAETAILDLAVTRGDGDPAQAALSLAGVDEAVFALAEMRPGLERVYFALQEEILKPRYEIHARPPVSPAEALTPPPEPEPEFEEATVVLFSAAEAPSPPAREASATFAEKQQRVRRARRHAEASVWDALALIPFGVHLLAVGLLLLYALSKLFHRAPLQDASEADLESLRRSTVGLIAWWIVGFIVPVVVIVTVVLVCDSLRLYAQRGVFAVTAGLGTAVLMLGLLIYYVWLFRRSPASQGVPLLRKLVVAVPVGYAAAAVTFPSLIAAAENWGGFVEDDAAVGLLLAAGVAALLVPGALSVAGHCATRRVSAGRWLWLMFSRCALALTPVLLAGMLLPALSRAQGYARRAAPGMETVDAAVPTDEGGGALKAPARVRRHFPETLLWRPEVITDEQGRARLEVPLADSITTWRLAMSAVSRQGDLGAAQAGIRVFQDFFVDIDVPVALTQHDVVSVPVAVFNYLGEPQTVRLDVEPADWFALQDEASKTLRIGPREVTSVRFTLEAETPGRHKLLVRAHGSEMADAVERAVRVEPDGRPVVQTVNGRLSDNLTREIAIPPEAIDGASDLIVKIYPGAFSQVVEGLDSIFRMPHGCFEQTTSTTYPNVLVLDYMRRTRQIQPELELKALNYINLGYQRLVSYEVSGGGFSLYGREPAVPVLTVYGLMEFADMAEVYDVDPKLIERTRQWLLDRQAEDGTWAEPGYASGVRGGPLRVTAYIAWAIASSGEAGPGLDPALSRIDAGAPKSDDAYTLALCANALLAAHHPAAKPLLQRLVAMRVEEDRLVHWTGRGTGVTWSRGDVLDIETTALAAQALLASPDHTSVAHKALAWLVEHKDAHGTWHSTQATVQAMRALLAGAGRAGGIEGTLNVTVAANGQLARELTITPETSDVHRLISLREMVREGTNTVALESSGQGDLAYQIVATHYVPWTGGPPASEKEMSIDVAYDTTTLKTDD
ncbi:MAG: MG2 domain-containing protein, partial [Planctomycetota bacterium]